MKTGSLRIPGILACAAFGLLFSANAAAQSAELAGAPTTPPDVVSPAAPINLALTGAAVTGVWYGGALGASLIWSNAPWATEMKIPLVGPWLSLNQIQCGNNEPNCTTLLVVARAVLMTIDGVGQAAGVAFVLESLFVPTASRQKPKPARAGLRPFPLVTSDALGIGLRGDL